MKSKKLKLMCVTGIFTAAVFITTAYLHIPFHTGYIHIGDAFVFLSASLLPLPFALFSGAAGAFLADCLTGYAIFSPASLIIKGLSAVFFTAKKEKILTVRNILALIPCAVICIGGYYLYEALITGNFIAPLSGITGNVIQSVFSSAFYIACAVMLDRIKIKDKIRKS